MAARGDYSAADRMLVCEPWTTGDPHWQSLALSARGSFRRQVGDLEAARACDERALALADSALSLADAGIGLAADHVAMGDAVGAHREHREARSRAIGHWRTLTRWHWVGAEHALLVADRALATMHADAAARACSGQSARHEAKSAIIQAAVSGRTASLPSVLETLLSHGWDSLMWPLALVAADHPAGTDPGWVDAAWVAGRDATYRIGESLTGDLAGEWRRHPGVLRLRGSTSPTSGE